MLFHFKIYITRVSFILITSYLQTLSSKIWAKGNSKLLIKTSHDRRKTDTEINKLLFCSAKRCNFDVRLNRDSISCHQSRPSRFRSFIRTRSRRDASKKIRSHGDRMIDYRIIRLRYRDVKVSSVGNGIPRRHSRNHCVGCALIIERLSKSSYIQEGYNLPDRAAATEATLTKEEGCPIDDKFPKVQKSRRPREFLARTHRITRIGLPKTDT